MAEVSRVYGHTTTAHPGWYAQGSVMRYWDGVRWTSFVAPRQTYATQACAVTQHHVRAQHVSGCTTGGHIVWAIASVCTLGLAVPFWVLSAFLGRRKIS